MVDASGLARRAREVRTFGVGLRAYVRDFGIGVTLISLFIGLAIASPAFLSKENLFNVLDQWSTIGIVAAGQTLVIIAGGFDLSAGAMFALSGIVAAVVTNEVGLVPGVLAAIGTGAALGCGNGLVVTKLKVHSFLGTLSTGLVMRGAAFLITGASVIIVSNPRFIAIANDSAFGARYPVYIAAGAIFILGFVLSRTVFGEHIRAVGGNADAARVAGVQVDLIRLLTFVMSGVCAGLAGMVLASRVAGGQANAGLNLEFTAITAVVLGGTSIFGGEGAIWRTIVGVLILALIGNGFNLLAFDPVYQPIVYGGIIAGAVAVDAWSRKERSSAER